MSTIWYNVYIQGGDILICEKHMIYNTRLSDERIYIQEIGSEAGRIFFNTIPCILSSTARERLTGSP